MATAAAPAPVAAPTLAASLLEGVAPGGAAAGTGSSAGGGGGGSAVVGPIQEPAFVPVSRQSEISKKCSITEYHPDDLPGYRKLTPGKDSYIYIIVVALFNFVKIGITSQTLAELDTRYSHYYYHNKIPGNAEVYMCIHMYASMYTCMCMHVCMCIPVYVCIYVNVYVCMCMYRLTRCITRRSAKAIRPRASASRS